MRPFSKVKLRLKTAGFAIKSQALNPTPVIPDPDRGSIRTPRWFPRLEQGKTNAEGQRECGGFRLLPGITVTRCRWFYLVCDGGRTAQTPGFRPSPERRFGVCCSGPRSGSGMTGNRGWGRRVFCGFRRLAERRLGDLTGRQEIWCQSVPSESNRRYSSSTTASARPRPELMSSMLDSKWSGLVVPTMAVSTCG